MYYFNIFMVLIVGRGLDPAVSASWHNRAVSKARRQQAAALRLIAESAYLHEIAKAFFQNEKDAKASGSWVIPEITRSGLSAFPNPYDAYTKGMRAYRAALSSPCVSPT